MDFRFTEEQEKLRQEVRQFLEEELPQEPHAGDNDMWASIRGFSEEFSRKMGRKGYIGITWPKEYGGQERTYLERLIVSEELFRYGAPVYAHWAADRQVGPGLLHFGTEEQRRKYLPGIIKGELYFALGMSEPEAGSDLASLRTRAIEQDDCFLVNGQKLWTSMAHRSQYMYLLARTDPDVPKHKGISEFLIPTDLTGITMRPVIDMCGEHHFNEVFFDNVRVPKDCLLGEKNNGWYQSTAHLDYERGGIERVMSNYPLYRQTIEFVKEAGLSKVPWIRQELADLEVEFQVARLLCYRVAWMLTEGIKATYETAMAKLFGMDHDKRFSHTVTKILGLYSQLMPESKYTLFKGYATMNFLWGPSYTFGAGTAEIMRNIIAIRGLGLPAR
jgi:alkylation response protein AidB-like acyl-CoA dehydrogenase